MNIGIAITLILGFILVYIFLIEVYSILFRITGLTKIKSRFQAISLLTNSGYTTSEAEVVTTNKMRRKIAMASMLTGYVFSVIIVSLVFNLINQLSINSIKDSYITIIIVVSAFALLLIIFKLPFVKKPLENFIEKIARKVMTKNIKENVITLLDIYENDCIAEITINNIPEPLVNKRLIEINIRDIYKINVLMIKRNGSAIVANKATMIMQNDIVVVFGPLNSIKKFFNTKQTNE